MTTFPAAGDVQDAGNTVPEQKAIFEAWLAATKQLPGAAAETELTIAAGVIVPTGFQHRVDTEADAAADNLDQIALTNLPDGAEIRLVPENAARVATLRHLNGTATPGTDGEMVLTNDENFALDHAGKWIRLRRKGTQWIEVARSTVFGRRVGAVADAAALRSLAALAGTGVANTFTALQAWAKGTDIASASPLVIGSNGIYFDVTGTTGFSAMTVAAGALFVLQFDGALTLTDGASLDLGGNNITTAAGDRAIFYATAANTVQLLAYLTEGASPKPPAQAEAEAGTATIPRPWTAQRVAQAIAALATGEIAESYEGTNATVTADTTFTFAHGLSGMPKIVDVRLVCTSADAGAAVGNEIQISPSQDSDFGAMRFIDATNIEITVGAALRAISQSTFNNVSLDLSKWDWVVRAWR